MRVMITQPSESRSPEPSPLVNRANEVYVIDGLLDLALKLSAPSFLDIRLAARDCLKAYFQQHQAIRHHFLRRAVEGHQSGSDETANILTTLLDPPSSSRSDPYQVWLAAVLLLAILYDDYEAKEIVRSVTQGDASTGEEVVSCVTLVSGHMLDAIGRQEDDRIPIAYLMLLCCWLWEEPDSVNDFLSEGSQLQSLLDAANGNRPDQKIVQGLCVLLLGIIYEFSTKDSVIPRADISALLLGKLGRDQYVDKLGKLREEPSLRDFEVLPQVSSNGRAGGLPEVFFEKEFVDFVRDNFSRLLRSIDREPGLEISVITNGVQKGISRELVDSLNGQLEEKTQALQKAEAEILEYERKLGQEQADHRRTREIAAAETTTVRTINAALQKQHDEELGTWREQSKREIDQLKIDHQSEREATRRHSVQSRNDNERDFQHLKVRHNNDLTELKRKLESAETELLTLRERYDAEIKAKSKEHEDRIRLLEQNAAASEREKHGVHTQLVAAKDAKKVKEAARQETQDQLDDLLMVFADLEAKRVSDKKRLKALGEEVSDFEEEEEEV